MTGGTGLVLCHFGCGARINPNDRHVWRAMHGWERKGVGETRRGGSDIALRTPISQFACDRCIERLKHGLAPAQETLR